MKTVTCRFPYNHIRWQCISIEEDSNVVEPNYWNDGEIYDE